MARKLLGSSRPRALILMYHRIAEASYDPHQLCVTPRHFAEHLDVLRRQAHPLSLREFERAAADGDLPPRAAVVTCDDGYADNLISGLPLLERCAIPATVFVASGYLGSAREFWWDELERILLRSDRLPETLELTIERRVHRWKLDVSARNDTLARDRVPGRTPALDGELRSRQGLYRVLHGLLQPLGAHERRSLLDQLRSWAASPAGGVPGYRALSAEEVGRLASGGLVDVGAHSVSHPLLPARPAAEQADEIGRSRTDLEAIVGRPVASFAYPFGGRSELTVALVREAGFRHAYAGVGAVRGRTEPWQIPRLPVSDCGGEEFARRLRGWFRGWPWTT